MGATIGRHLTHHQYLASLNVLIDLDSVGHTTPSKPFPHQNERSRTFSNSLQRDKVPLSQQLNGYWQNDLVMALIVHKKFVVLQLIISNLVKFVIVKSHLADLIDLKYLVTMSHHI